MGEKRINIFESFITIAIILVVIHTFLEDVAIVARWGEGVQGFFMIAGFFFDLIFTVEFLIRMGFAIQNGRGTGYFLHKKGWIDFLASIPLLMFNSGPVFFASILGGAAFAGAGGILNMLKLVKAIRIARVLRLLRVLKIFKKIKYADSEMAQRHVTKIITIGVTTLVFTLFTFTTLSGIFDFSGIQREREDFMEKTASIVTEAESRGNLSGTLRDIEPFSQILMVWKGDRTLYSKYDPVYYKENIRSGDFDKYEKAGLTLYFDKRDFNSLQTVSQAGDSLIFFFVVLLLVIAYLVFYSPHFALTVSDPIYVMRRGMAEPSYNLNVKVPDRFKDDDVYKLSVLYNEEFLPLKDRNSETGGAEPELQMEDFKDLFDPGEF